MGQNYYDGKCRNPRCEHPSRTVQAQTGVAFRGAAKPTGKGNYWDVYHTDCAAARNRDPMEEYQGFVPSHYQQAVADAWTQTDEHLIVDAVAGSGKTKTILWLLASTWSSWVRQLGRKPRVLVCAFNRAIREGLELRIAPGTASPLTLNSLGNSLVSQHLRALGLEPMLESRKLWNVIKRLYPCGDEEYGESLDYSKESMAGLYECLYDEEPPVEFDQDTLGGACELGYRRNAAMRTSLARLVSLQRATLSDDSDRLSRLYGIELPWLEGIHDDEVEEACEAALFPAVERVLRELQRDAVEKGLIDYDDQVWLPHALSLRGTTYDAVFVDEAQDLNEAQLSLIRKIVGAHGRMVFVGDPMQAIYSFRGAGIGMIDRIERALEDTERGVARLPLSVCYRCPIKVIDVVRAGGRVMQIEPAPGAPPGEILFFHEKEPWTEEIKPGSMILCRTNAPLALAYFALLREKVPATIRGRGDDGIHKKLVKLVDRSDSGSSVARMLKRASGISQRRIENLWASRRYNEAVQASDLFHTLSVLACEVESVRGLRREIEGIFGPDQEEVEKERVTLSSIHKAKGLEAPDIFVIRPDLLPLMTYARTPNDIEQEKNLEYVCYTRAQSRLIFVQPRSVRQRSEEIQDLFPEIELEGADWDRAPVI